MKVNSVRFKISILYTIVLGIILFVYSAMLYLNLSYVVYHEIDKNLRKKATEIEDVINTYSKMLEADQESTPSSLKRVVHLDEFERDEFFQWPSIKRLDQFWKYKIQTLGIKQDYIVIFYPSGEIVEKSNNIDAPALALLEKEFRGVPKDKVFIKNSVMSKEEHLRIITTPFFRWGRIKYIIQLATPLEPKLFILKSKLKLILMTIPVFMLFASFLGAFFVTRIFKPIAEITQTARTISHKDMSKRVELVHADEEIKSLVDGFNDMIARLEKSFEYIEEFSSNVAHELKTPLAIIRGELEVVQRKERPIEEYRKAIAIALDEVEGMLKTTNDLLLLAKLDYRPEVFKFERIDLVEFLTEIHEQTRMLAAQKNIEVSAALPRGPVYMQADRIHLRRLFFNLFDNAIKFTPKGGRVDITAQRQDGVVSVAISDTGVGIAEDDLPRIFDRFFHVDRTDEAPSTNGLGLSIVQSIARIHNGTVDAASQLGKGSTFTVRLPLAN